MKSFFSRSVIGLLLPTLLGLLLLLFVPIRSMSQMEALHRTIDNEITPARERVQTTIEMTHQLHTDAEDLMLSTDEASRAHFKQHKAEWLRVTRHVPTVTRHGPEVVAAWEVGIAHIRVWLESAGNNNVRAVKSLSSLPGEQLVHRGLAELETADHSLAQQSLELREKVHKLEQGTIAATGGLAVVCGLLALFSLRNAVALSHALAAESRNADRLIVAVKETNHRVKNNLQTIGALIDMNRQEYGAQIPRRVLDDIYQQVRTVAAVHDFLSYEQQVNQVAIRPMLDKLVTLTASGKEMKTDIKAVSLELPVKAATAIALIVNELVLNAGKHGAKCVQVEFGMRASQCVLCVSDDGPGLPTNFSVDEHGNLGTMLVQTLARHDLGGDVQWRNGSHLPGACVEIAFPMPKGN